MNARLTLGEKLKDLRVSKKLKLADVEAATGISTSTLQRLESDADTRVGYPDIEVLTRFYEVSADFLFGLTDNDNEHREYEIDKLRLSDAAIDVLKDGQLNNRLISEFLSHDDFPQLLRAMEIYIDRKVLPQMNTMNAMYKMTEQALKVNTDISDSDELLAFLQLSVVDEDEYLRSRISERFNMVMKSLFDSHKKDKPSPEYADMLAEMKEDVQTFLDTQKTETVNKGKAIVLCKKLGLNTSKLDDEEWRVLMKVLDASAPVKRAKKRK
ncbi:helix-turn-helix domain-containing protein [Christensenellaceae bacterium OttesenSCG-928-M15]|nr:helix-turn-helix domain-containing protein [Christensenellaceae bacterium OttesenSCG-928-M15]